MLLLFETAVFYVPKLTMNGAQTRVTALITAFTQSASRGTALLDNEVDSSSRPSSGIAPVGDEVNSSAETSCEHRKEGKR